MTNTADNDNDVEYTTSMIETLQISKARKKEGYYLCPVKDTFTIDFKRAHVLSIKGTSNTLIIKSKEMTRYMDSLNDKIIKIVQDNSTYWFNTHIDNDLIDEYYISTLQYDKRRGETIRLKVKNIDELDDVDVMDAPSRIVVSLKHLKFFKQKFYPEFQIELLEEAEDAENTDETCLFNDTTHDDLYVDEDEHPLPSFEEVMSMKEEFVSVLKKECDDLADKMLEIEEAYKDKFEKLTYLQNCDNLSKIIEFCEECEKNNTCE
jgi:hypothetical protein